MLDLLLWRAVVRDRRWLVWTIFVFAVIPALLQIAQMIYVTFGPRKVALQCLKRRGLEGFWDGEACGHGSEGSPP